jgi:hypothetical protein
VHLLAEADPPGDRLAGDAEDGGDLVLRVVRLAGVGLEDAAVDVVGQRGLQVAQVRQGGRVGRVGRDPVAERRDDPVAGAFYRSFSNTTGVSLARFVRYWVLGELVTLRIT